MSIEKQLILNCIKKQGSTLEVALKLGISRRAVQQKIANYKLKGDNAFIHGNTGKKHLNPDFETKKKKVTDIFLNTRINGINPFECVSYMFFTSILKDDYNIDISVSSVKKILNETGYKSPIKYKIKKSKQIHLIRQRREQFGELLQADGSSFDWFGNGKKCCIHGFIDDATSIPTGLYITENECLLGYVEAFRITCFDYGLPEQLYSDKASVFYISRKMKDKNTLTQFGKMMKKLGVEMFPANSPQAKGRIERLWHTLQQQLPIQFKLHGITHIDGANQFLKDVYIPQFIRKYSVKPKVDISKFVKADMSEINKILRVKFIVKTDNAGVFSLFGYRFFCPYAKKKLFVYMTENDGIYGTLENSEDKIKLKVVETDTTGSMPEVTKNLIDKVFLQNAKAKYREVYWEVDLAELEKF